MSLRTCCLLLYIGVIFLAYPVHAQQRATVRGTVTDDSGGKPLAGVSVYLANTLIGAATNADGAFVLSSVPPGTYVLRARFIGFREFARDITAEAGQTLDLDIRLRIEPVSMTTVEVEALRPDLQPYADMRSSQVRESNPRDAGEVLRALPGVNAARRGPIGLDPNVRGLSETEVGAYVDGVRRFPAGPLRMDSQISHFDPSVIDRIEVVKGPYALTWGAGNMGAIRVQTKTVSPAAGPIHGYLRSSYESNENASGQTGALFGSKNRLTYWLHGAYRRGQDYKTGDGQTVPADYGTAEARGKVGVRLTPTAMLTLAGGYQDQRNIDYPGRLLNADYFRAGDLSARYELSRPGRMLQGIDALVYWHRVDHGMDNDDKPTAIAGTFPDGSPRPPLIIKVDAQMESVGGRFVTDLRTAPAQEIKLGGDIYHAYRDARRPFYAVMNGNLVVPPFYTSDRAWPGVTIVDGGLFANLRRAAGYVSLSATARADVVRSDAAEPSEVFLTNADVDRGDLRRTETNLSGAATVSWRASHRWDLSAGVGSVVRSPDALELYSDRFPASKAQTSAEFQGNPFLEPERSTQADLWIDGAYPRVSVSLNAFARTMSNYITLEATDLPKLLPLSPNTVYTYVNGSATFIGLEAAVAWAVLDRFTLSVSSSYLRGTDREVDEPAFGVSPLRAAAGLRYESGDGRFFAEATTDVAAAQDRVASTRGELPTDGYVRADLRTGYEIWHGLSLLAGVRNLTDAAYVNHLNARNPFSGVPIAEPGRSFFASASVTF